MILRIYKIYQDLVFDLHNQDFAVGIGLHDRNEKTEERIMDNSKLFVAIMDD